MTDFSTLYGRLLDQELGTDDSTVLFTTARRKAAVNDGQAEFADLTECLVRVSTLTIVSTASEYDLNSTTNIPGGDYTRLASAQPVEFWYTDNSSFTQYLAGDDLIRRDLQWLNRYEPAWRDSTSVSTGPQTPRLYYLRAAGPQMLLGFYPAPSSGSSAAMKALVPYVARPADLTSDTQEPFEVNSSRRQDLRPYHLALVHYAAHQLEKLRRDREASDGQLRKFLGYVTRYLQQMRPKGGQSLTLGRQYFRPQGSVTDRPRDVRT
jgi:hypothetical protein